MKVRIILIIMLITLIGTTAIFGQGRRFRPLRNSYAAPEEIVSLSNTMTFSQALSLFNDLSKKFLGKIIVDPEGRNFPIGEDIEKMHWLDAMELILKLHDLWYEEYEDYIKIIPTGGSADDKKLSAMDKKMLMEFDNREVVITAVFFETDISKLRQAGMSWDIFRGGGANARVNMSAAETQSGLFQIDVNPDWDFADVVATFKALESDNIGEVISSPQVTVKSGGEGRVQVGSDISVTIQDFAGNAITQFFSTGSIIRVKPVIMSKDSIDFIILDLEVERSNTATGDVGLEIRKSKAETDVLLLDGEETIIGGLFINEETNAREGIPFLKDLPWWFFGLRYVFGFETKTVRKKELIILLKAELLPSLQDRFESKVTGIRKTDLLIEYNRAFKNKMRYYERKLKNR
jgi:hypothetical protein